MNEDDSARPNLVQSRPKFEEEKVSQPSVEEEEEEEEEEGRRRVLPMVIQGV